MKNNKGFSIIVLIISVLLILSISGNVYLFFQNKNNISKEIITQKKDENKLNKETAQWYENCATPEMFAKESPKILEPLNQEELSKMTTSKFDYLNVINFYGNEGDLILNVSGAGINSNEELYIANRLVSGGPGSYLTSSFNFRKSDCIKPIYPHQIELGERINKIIIKKSDITIFQVPGCCTGYNADAIFYIELNEANQKKINSKYIEVTPWYYDLKEFEKVLRSIEFLPLEN